MGADSGPQQAREQPPVGEADEEQEGAAAAQDEEAMDKDHTKREQEVCFYARLSPPQLRHCVLQWNGPLRCHGVFRTPVTARAACVLLAYTDTTDAATANG